MPVTKNEDVMSMVRKELDKDPDVETGTLFEKAKGIDSSLKDLSLRQFHARYPLQVKRKMSSAKGRKKKRRKSGKKKQRKSRGRARSAAASSDENGASREAVRDGLLTFARDVAAAEGKADLIGVLTSVDDYVDDVLAGLAKSRG